MYGFDGKWEEVVFLTVLALSLGVSDLGMVFLLGPQSCGGVSKQVGPQRRIGGEDSSNYTKGVCFSEDARV